MGFPVRYIAPDRVEEVEVCTFSRTGIWAWLDVKHPGKFNLFYTTVS